MKFSAVAIVIIVLICGLVDMPRGVAVGATTALGALSIAYALLSWLLVVACFSIPKSAAATKWLVLFLIWCFGSLMWTSTTFLGTQNLAVYSSFVGVLLLSATVTSHSRDMSRYIETSLRWATLIATGLYLLKFVYSFNASMSVGNRTFALLALVALAWYLAEWRYVSQRGMWCALAIVVVIGLSLSRMALFVALLLVPLSQMNPKSGRSWVKFGALVGAVSGVSLAAITYIEPIRQRFFEGDASVQVGGMTINASGRTTFWEPILLSFYQSPWIGNGAGSAQEVLLAAFPTVAQPHNEYLRLLHDFGLFGMCLWLLGYGGLMWTTARAWLRERDAKDARAHLAAFLSLTAIAITMATDNVIVYVFVMVPLGAIVGNSLGCLNRANSLVPNRTTIYTPSRLVRRWRIVGSRRRQSAFP